MNITQKTALSAAFATTAFIAGCNLNSSDEAKKEVDSYGEMPPCVENQGTSGSDIEGAKLFVKDEEATYICTDTGWLLFDNSEGDYIDEPTPMLENELLEGTVSALGPFVKKNLRIARRCL